jgi:hypothetical protein
MKRSIRALAVMLVLGAVLTDAAWAGGGRGHVSISVGTSWGAPGWGPGWGPGWRAGWWWGPGWGPRWGWSPVWGPGVVVAPTVVWPAPAVAVPPAVVVPSVPPTVYIERDEPATAAPAPPQQPGHWWYYCQSSRAFYPYARECAEGWQRVPPAPPS